MHLETLSKIHLRDSEWSFFKVKSWYFNLFFIILSLNIYNFDSLLWIRNDKIFFLYKLSLIADVSMLSPWTIIFSWRNKNAYWNFMSENLSFLQPSPPPFKFHIFANALTQVIIIIFTYLNFMVSSISFWWLNINLTLWLETVMLFEIAQIQFLSPAWKIGDLMPESPVGRSVVLRVHTNLSTKSVCSLRFTWKSKFGFIQSNLFKILFL